MVKKVLDWTEEKMDGIMDDIDNGTDKHPYLKAFGLGAIEGFIDGAVIAYPFLLIACIMKNREIKKLKGE